MATTSFFFFFHGTWEVGVIGGEVWLKIISGMRQVAEWDLFCVHACEEGHRELGIWPLLFHGNVNQFSCRCYIGFNGNAQIYLTVCSNVQIIEVCWLAQIKKLIIVIAITKICTGTWGQNFTLIFMAYFC